MANTSRSILDDIKASIGIVPEYTAFDNQLILLINSTFSTLHQLGFGPDEGFEIIDDTITWDDYIPSPRLNFIKEYIISNVHLAFDPPTSSIAKDILEKRINELTFRINSEVECYNYGEE